ncbi:MAG TPA: GNAT family N-acyltransferase [Kineosporiaceae bacterium]
MVWRFVDAPVSGQINSGVYLAQTQDDFDGVNLVCDDVYGRECGWLGPDAIPLTKDPYHASSTYLVAADAGRLVGIMRLVADSAQGLPVEQFASVDPLRGAPGSRRLIECQRLMVLNAYRNVRLEAFPYGVFAGLVKGCLHWCLTHGWTHIVADLFLNTATTPMTTLLAIGFEDTGIEFVDTELAEPDRSVALLLRVGELFSRTFRSNSPFYRYLIERDPTVRVYH